MHGSALGERFSLTVHLEWEATALLLLPTFRDQFSVSVARSVDSDVHIRARLRRVHQYFRKLRFQFVFTVKLLGLSGGLYVLLACPYPQVLFNFVIDRTAN